VLAPILISFIHTTDTQRDVTRNNQSIHLLVNYSEPK